MSGDRGPARGRLRELASGAGASLVVRVVGTGLSFVLQWVLVRSLGAAQYGLYTWLLAWVSLLLLAAVLGQDSALLRFVPQYRSQGREGWVGAMTAHADRGAWIGSAVLAGISALMLWGLPGVDPGGALAAFLPAAVLLPLLALLRVREAALRAVRRVVASQAPVLIGRPVVVVGLVLVLWIGRGRPLRAVEALAINAIAIAAMLLVAHAIWRRVRPPRGGEAVPPAERRAWWRIGLVLLGVSGLHETMRRFDLLMLGWLADTETVGIYNMAMLYSSLLAFGLEAVNMIQAPMIGELHAAERHRELQRVLRFGGWLTIGFTLPAAAVLILAGRPLLGLFGPGFEAGYTALVLIAAGQLLNAMAGPVGFLTTMTGHHRQAFRAMLAATLVNVALNVALIPRFGMAGAALASLVATAVWNVWLHRFVRRTLGLSSTPLLPIGRSA